MHSEYMNLCHIIVSTVVIDFNNATNISVQSTCMTEETFLHELPEFHQILEYIYSVNSSYTDTSHKT